MYARPFIDSPDFARNGREISGEVPVAGLPRLQDLLENPQGILSYTVRGSIDKQGVSFLDISVTGSCRLRCQRCLEGMDYPVRIEVRLLLRDQATLDALDSSDGSDEDEPFDSILAEANLDVLDLLEEEVLLSLPIAPRHEAGVCQAADAVSVAHVEEKSPFAALAKLKGIGKIEGC